MKFIGYSGIGCMFWFGMMSLKNGDSINGFGWIHAGLLCVIIAILIADSEGEKQ